MLTIPNGMTFRGSETQKYIIVGLQVFRMTLRNPCRLFEDSEIAIGVTLRGIVIREIRASHINAALKEIATTPLNTLVHT